VPQPVGQRIDGVEQPDRHQPVWLENLRIFAVPHP
jgi:hypothetical protein